MVIKNKKEYMNELSKYLSGILDTDYEDAMRFVDEYFEEAGEENVQQVLDELGPPERYASIIRADAAQKRTYTNRKETGKSIWLIILGIFALPIGIPLLIALCALIFALLLVLFSVLLALFCACFMVIIVSIFSLVTAIGLLIADFASGLIAFGISLILICVGVVSIYAMIKLSKICVRATSNVIKKIYSRLRGKGVRYEEAY